MYDIPKIRTVLEGFRTLPVSRVYQPMGQLFPHNMSGSSREPECGACVGSWIAHFLGLPLREPEQLHCYWDFRDGMMEMARLLKVDIYKLDIALTDCGAPAMPFGGADWRNSPYRVIRDAVKALTRYDHAEYLRTLPVPLKELEGHEVLVEMP